MYKPCIPYIEDICTFFVSCREYFACPACSKRMSKENAKGWLPSWIRHRLVESCSEQNVSHRHFSSLLQHKDCGIGFLYVQKLVIWLESGRKLVMQRRTTGQPGFIAFQSTRLGTISAGYCRIFWSAQLWIRSISDFFKQIFLILPSLCPGLGCFWWQWECDFSLFFMLWECRTMKGSAFHSLHPQQSWGSYEEMQLPWFGTLKSSIVDSYVGREGCPVQRKKRENSAASPTDLFVPGGLPKFAEASWNPPCIIQMWTWDMFHHVSCLWMDIRHTQAFENKGNVRECYAVAVVHLMASC